MCMGSSPAPVVYKEPARRDMTYAYKDANLTEVQVPSTGDVKASTVKKPKPKTPETTKSPLNIG